LPEVYPWYAVPILDLKNDGSHIGSVCWVLQHCLNNVIDLIIPVKLNFYFLKSLGGLNHYKDHNQLEPTCRSDGKSVGPQFWTGLAKVELRAPV
jgi:hypothetical protein